MYVALTIIRNILVGRAGGESLVLAADTSGSTGQRVARRLDRVASTGRRRACGQRPALVPRGAMGIYFALAGRSEPLARRTRGKPRGPRVGQRPARVPDLSAQNARHVLHWPQLDREGEADHCETRSARAQGDVLVVKMLEEVARLLNLRGQDVCIQISDILYSYEYFIIRIF